MKILPIILIAIQISSFVFAQSGTIYTPAQITSSLGKGFDVAWSEFLKKAKRYRNTLPQMIYNAGFSNVRIRMNTDYPNATWLGNLSKQINDSLSIGLFPIIAHQLAIIQTGTFTTFQQDKNYITELWKNFTQWFNGYSYKLLFNIWVEVSGKYGNNSTALSQIYTSVINGVRAIDPYRIIIVSPVKLSDPDYLPNLILPADDYLMAQWHFYAAGPNIDPKNPKYWSKGDTKVQRDNILLPIQSAMKWMKDTGKKTWVGAWMAGNYNKGNNFPVQQQVGFASFMSRSLQFNNIPFSVNTDDKFIDFDYYYWYPRTPDAGGIPVRDAILDPNQIALYEGQTYTGRGIRFAIGNYDTVELSSKNFVYASSIMVPLDFQVTLFSEAGFSGQSVIYSQTSVSLNGFVPKSFKVEYFPKIF